MAVATYMLILFSIIFIAGCTTQNGDFIEGNATVTDIDILILESFPVQVNVVAKGYFPDSCTRIGMQIVGKGGNTFFVELKTSRPADVFCAQVITPFEEVIPLDVLGLKAGNYTVDVNGVTGTFELQIDNVPQQAEEKNYVSTDPDECTRIQVLCVEGFERFDDETGCGCQKLT